MAFFGEQQSNLKYFCKICKKGFGCGRALGGHMRAHGICDESGYIDNEDQESDWEYNIGGGGGNNNNNNNDTAPINKRMYALRTNPNRQKSCKSCENCGMEFVSWKSFLEHGKCSSSKDVEPLMSLSGSDFEDTTNGGRGTGWFKRKRSFRAKVDNLGLGLNSNNCPLSEEEDLANCLMMLSNATVELEESSASAREEEEWGIAAGPEPPMLGDNHKAIVVASSSSKRLFECKACKKVFNSHQALGGHRASHKKVKGCFAARLVHLDDEDETMHDEFFTSSSKSNSQLLKFDASLASPSKRKSKTHECSICHRIFSSGQALGGHKRCHWITSNLTETCTTTTDNTFHHQPHDLMEKISQRPTGIGKSEAFDLNFPVLHDEVVGNKRDPKHRLSFEAEVSTEIGLRPWMEPDDQKKNNDSSAAKVTAIAISNDNEGNNEKASLQNPESEATSKVKLAKLSELDDINLNSGASFWLQVGLGSDKNVGVDV